MSEQSLSPAALREELNSAWEKRSDPGANQTKASELQIGGDHYKVFVIQPYKFCLVNKLNNLQSEIISYVCRYPHKWKGNIEKQREDLRKAKHTIDLILEELGH